jgi:hypothetical protein
MFLEYHIAKEEVSIAVISEVQSALSPMVGVATRSCDETSSKDIVAEVYSRRQYSAV